MRSFLTMADILAKEFDPWSLLYLGIKQIKSLLSIPKTVKLPLAPECGSLQEMILPFKISSTLLMCLSQGKFGRALYLDGTFHSEPNALFHPSFRP